MPQGENATAIRLMQLEERLVNLEREGGMPAQLSIHQSIDKSRRTPLDKYDAEGSDGEKVYDDARHVLNQRLKRTISNLTDGENNFMPKSELRKYIENQKDINALKDRIHNFEDTLGKVLNDKFFEEDGMNPGMVRIKDFQNISQNEQIDMSHVDEIIKLFDGRLMRLMKSVESIQINVGDFEHLMVSQKKSIRRMQNRIEELECAEVDLDELLVEEGAALKADDFVKYMKKIQTDLQNRMLTQKDLKDIKDRLGEIDTVSQQCDELKDEMNDIRDIQTTVSANKSIVREALLKVNQQDTKLL